MDNFEFIDGYDKNYNDLKKDITEITNRLQHIQNDIDKILSYIEDTKREKKSNDEREMNKRIRSYKKDGTIMKFTPTNNDYTT